MAERGNGVRDQYSSTCSRRLSSVLTIRAVNVLILAVTVFVLYRVVTSWTRPAVGIFAGLLVTGLPPARLHGHDALPTDDGRPALGHGPVVGPTERTSRDSRSSRGWRGLWPIGPQRD